MTKRKEILKVNLETIEFSSVHGLTNLVKNKFIPIKILWVIFILTSASGCFYFLIISFQQYFEYKVRSNTEIIHEQKLTFPSVKICDLNLVTDQTNDSFSNQYLNRYDFLIRKLELQSYWKEMNITYRSKYVSSLENFIITCLFNQKPCNLSSDFEAFYDFKYGLCHVFNPSKLNNRKQSFDARSSNGLILEIYVGSTDNNSYIYSYENGLDILIQDDIFDSTVTEGIKVPTGYLTYIGLDKYEIIQVEKPYSNCRKNLDRIDLFDSECYRKTLSSTDYKYKYVRCYDMCYQKYLGNQCHCQQSFSPAYYSSFRPCSGENDTICTQNALLMFISDVNFLEKCSCPRECKTTNYMLTTSLSEFPTKYYYKVLTNNEIIKMRFPNKNDLTYENLRKNIASINIFFNEIKETVINHEPSMSFADLVSNIGGTLGIFLGKFF